MMELIIYLTKASSVLVFFYLVFLVFLRKDTYHNFKRGFLLFGLATSLVLPLLTYNTYIDVKPVKEISTPLSTQLYITEVVTNQPVGSQPEIELSQPIDWFEIVTNIYFTVSFIVLAFLFYNYLKLSLRIRRFNFIRDENFRIYEVENLNSPFSFFKSIVISKNFESENERQMVIEHEKVHVSHYHWIDILMANLFLVVFWFNPILWLYRKEIRQNLEHIADQYAISKIQDKKTYQYLLLNQILPIYQSSIKSHFFQPSIKQRIMMINKTQTPKFNMLKGILVIPLLVVFFLNFQNKVIAQEIKKDKKEQLKGKNDSIQSALIDSIYNSLNEDKKSKLKSQSLKGVPELSYSVSSVTYHDNDNFIQQNKKSYLDPNTFVEKPFEILNEPAVKSSVEYGAGNKVLILKITKNASLEYLEYMKTLFRNKYKIYITYNNVQFDKDNLLTSIDLKILTRDAKSVDYKIDTENPIGDIYFYRDYSKQKTPELGIVKELPEFPEKTSNDELLTKIQFGPEENFKIEGNNLLVTKLNLEKVKTFIINGIIYEDDEFEEMFVLVKKYEFLNANTLDINGDVFRGKEIEEFYNSDNKASLKLENVSMIIFKKGEKPLAMLVGRNQDLKLQDLKEEKDRNKIVEIVNNGEVSRLIVTINKNADKKYLDYIEKYLEDEHQMQVKFSKVKYKEGLLNSIKVQIKTEEGLERVYYKTSNAPIDEFYIFRDFSKDAEVSFSIDNSLPEKNRKDIQGKVISTFQISPESYKAEKSAQKEHQSINIDKVKKFVINDEIFGLFTEEPMMVIVESHEYINDNELKIIGEVLKGDKLREFYDKEYISINPYGTKVILFGDKMKPVSMNIMEFRVKKSKNN